MSFTVQSWKGGFLFGWVKKQTMLHEMRPSDRDSGKCPLLVLVHAHVRSAIWKKM